MRVPHHRWFLVISSPSRLFPPLQASEPCAAGILQALRHFGMLPAPPPLPLQQQLLHLHQLACNDALRFATMTTAYSMLLLYKNPASMVAAAAAGDAGASDDGNAAVSCGGKGGIHVMCYDLQALAAAVASNGVWLDELEYEDASPSPPQQLPRTLTRTVSVSLSFQVRALKHRELKCYNLSKY